MNNCSPNVPTQFTKSQMFQEGRETEETFLYSVKVSPPIQGFTDTTQETHIDLCKK